MSCLLVGRHCSLWGWIAHILLRCCLRFLFGCLTFSLGRLRFFWLLSTLGLAGSHLARVLSKFGVVVVQFACVLFTCGQGIVYLLFGQRKVGKCRVYLLLGCLTFNDSCLRLAGSCLRLAWLAYIRVNLVYVWLGCSIFSVGLV